MCIVCIYMCTQNVSYQCLQNHSKTLMLPIRAKVTNVLYHLHKKICQTKVFVKHSYKATRLKTFIIFL
jgi:hypothetical protein